VRRAGIGRIPLCCDPMGPANRDPGTSTTTLLNIPERQRSTTITVLRCARVAFAKRRPADGIPSTHRVADSYRRAGTPMPATVPAR
jgi:hypothetical protein